MGYECLAYRIEGLSKEKKTNLELEGAIFRDV